MMRWSSVTCAVAIVSLSVVATGAQSPPAGPNGSRPPSLLGPIFNPYRPSPIPPVTLENSARLRDLVRDGRLLTADEDEVAREISAVSRRLSQA